MLEIRQPTPEAAFKAINNMLLFNEEAVEDHGKSMSSQRMLFDVMVYIARNHVDEDFNFTEMVNYRPAKWTSLVNNYISVPHYQESLSYVHHRELKKDKNYNISFQFSNKHGGGKGCLLSATFSRRPGIEQPMIIATVRASETVKRLMMDFHLLNRMGQDAFGEDVPFSIQIYFPYMWLASSWAALYIHWDKDAKAVVKHAKDVPFLGNIWKTYKAMKKCEDPQTLSYHAMRRVVKVVQNNTATPPLLAKHCTLNF